MNEPGDPGNPLEGLLGDLLKMIGGAPGGASAWFEAARSLAQGVATDGAPEGNVDPLLRIRLEELAVSRSSMWPTPPVWRCAPTLHRSVSTPSDEAPTRNWFSRVGDPGSSAWCAPKKAARPRSTSSGSDNSVQVTSASATTSPGVRGSRISWAASPRRWGPSSSVSSSARRPGTWHSERSASTPCPSVGQDRRPALRA